MCPLKLLENVRAPQPQTRFGYGAARGAWPAGHTYLNMAWSPDTQRCRLHPPCGPIASILRPCRILANRKLTHMPTPASPADDQHLYQRAYKLRLYPTAEQEAYFRLNIRACADVYNHFYIERKRAYKRTCKTLRRWSGTDADGKPLRDEKDKIIWEEFDNPRYDPDAKPMSFFDTSKALTVYKKEALDADGRRWLYDADATALVYALRNLERAYQNFFRRLKRGETAVGYPKMKRLGAAGSFKVAFKDLSKVVVDGHAGKTSGWVVLPKVGRVEARIHDMPEGVPVSATVAVSSAGRWTVSIQCKDVEIDPTKAEVDEFVGVTTGITPWVVVSDGTVYENGHYAKREKWRLRKAQRKLSRKQLAEDGRTKEVRSELRRLAKQADMPLDEYAATPEAAPLTARLGHSKKYVRQNRAVAKIQQRVADRRAYRTHCLTRELVDTYSGIAVRDMAVRSMMQNSKLKGKAKRQLNQALADANLAEINRQLAYKAEWAGRTFVEVDSKYPTAQTCSECGYKFEVLAKDLKKEWTCPKCGARHNRKANGAENVRQAGIDILAGKPVHAVSKNISDKVPKKRRSKKASDGTDAPVSE